MQSGNGWAGLTNGARVGFAAVDTRNQKDPRWTMRKRMRWLARTTKVCPDRAPPQAASADTRNLAGSDPASAIFVSGVADTKPPVTKKRKTTTTKTAEPEAAGDDEEPDEVDDDDEDGGAAVVAAAAPGEEDEGEGDEDEDADEVDDDDVVEDTAKSSGPAATAKKVKGGVVPKEPEVAVELEGDEDDD